MERERGDQPAEAAATHAPPSPPPPPPSSTSSPSHEFSFTISLHPFSDSTPSSTFKCSRSPPPPSALDIDLAPADDIFFHGHLLPLHLLSRPAISPPRPSDISIEDFSLPLRHIYQEQQAPENHYQLKGGGTTSAAAEAKERNKPKSLSSLFGFKKCSRKGKEDDSTEGKKKKKKKKKKKNKMLDIAGLLIRKYASMVLFFKGEKEKNDLRRRPYSFSGNLTPRGREGWRPKRRSEGGFSLPASKRSSPTNSGLLFASPTAVSSSDGSTMEELQNAIQAAIAHCKSSTGTNEDKCKLI